MPTRADRRDAPDLILRSRRVVLPEGVSPATLTIRGGRIASIRLAAAADDPVDVADAAVDVADLADGDDDVRDVGDLAVLPGLVDTHVHINEPGRTEWEGFETAGLAAAAGGVTTLIDMPLNSHPVTVTAGALALKVHAAAGACLVDYGFWGGLVPASVGRIEELAGAGALGFKAFLVDSGIAEFAPVGRAELEAAMPRIAALGLPLLVHAETPGPIETATGEARERLARRPELAGSHDVWLDGRPPSAESEAIDLLAELALATGCRVHIVHVSSGEGVDRVAAAKEAGAPLTAETCPHYLTFDGEAVPAGAVEYKCAPPIRGARHRDALWRALRGGVLDLVATDHSPCPPELKMDAPDGFFGAWGGIASLGLALPALWSSSESRGISLPEIARWMSAEPARLAGVGRSKGAIREGMDADLVIFDPEAEYELAAGDLRFRHPITPYLGARMRGRIVHTLSRGRLVFSAAGGAGGSGPAGPSSTPTAPSSWRSGSHPGGTWLR